MKTVRMLTTAGVHRLGRLSGRTPADDGRMRERGQVLAIFAVMSIVLLGGAALVTDVTNWWMFEQRLQRAADAAALAGAVYMPDFYDTKATPAAIAEAKRNGFDDASPNVDVTTRRDPSNPRKLIVDIDAPVQTNFARVFCWEGGPCLDQVDVGVTGAAEYVLPVPMGSPENYYGVFGTLRGATFTELVEQTNVTNATQNSGPRVATTAPAGTWTASSGTLIAAVNSNNNVYARTTVNGAVHQWGTLGIVTPTGGAIPVPAANQVFTITGIEVLLSDAFVSASCSNSRIGAQLSWDGGTTWTTPAAQTGNLTTSTSADYILGSASSLAAWPKTGQPWARDDFSDANFRVRLTGVKGCSTSTIRITLDHLEVRVTYNIQTTTTSMVEQQTTTSDSLKGPGTACANGADDCYDPDGSDLNPRGFWATMNTRGASNVNGDAHQPYYDTAGGTVAPTCTTVGNTRACYDASQYYNYAVEMPPNSTGGYVYVFDPGFCATANNKGTGDRWFGSTNAVSSWYELRGTNATPYIMTDDPLIASTGDLFTNMDASNSTMGGSSGLDCRKRDTAYGDGRDYHLSWYLLNPDNPLTGGPRGTVYRIHTTGTDPSGIINSTTDGEQSFALYATATGGSPRIYGLGAMQMFTPLCAGGYSGCPVSSTTTSSEFYLAQIDEVHAGKTVEIQLWDPGDTCSTPGSNCLAANLQILVPNSGGWTATPLDYTAQVGTTHSSVNTACNTNTGDGVSSITTSVSSTSLGRFNGCWLTIQIPVDVDYTAPQDGWWKIRYNMTGTGTSNDVTTWKVALIGNPVHLVYP